MVKINSVVCVNHLARLRNVSFPSLPNHELISPSQLPSDGFTVPVPQMSAAGAQRKPMTPLRGERHLHLCVFSTDWGGLETWAKLTLPFTSPVTSSHI